VAQVLDTRGNIDCFAKYDCYNNEYYEAIDRVLDFKPDITIDDGADFIFKLHKERTYLLPDILRGREETTTGIHRLHAMEKEGALKMSVIAVNDAMTKYLFDNRYGTGKSAWDVLTGPRISWFQAKTLLLQVIVGAGQSCNAICRPRRECNNS